MYHIQKHESAIDPVEFQDGNNVQKHCLLLLLSYKKNCNSRSDFIISFAEYRSLKFFSDTYLKKKNTFLILYLIKNTFYSGKKCFPWKIMKQFWFFMHFNVVQKLWAKTSLFSALISRTVYSYLSNKRRATHTLWKVKISAHRPKNVANKWLISISWIVIKYRSFGSFKNHAYASNTIDDWVVVHQN